VVEVIEFSIERDRAGSNKRLHLTLQRIDISYLGSYGWATRRSVGWLWRWGGSQEAPSRHTTGFTRV
jgi:hypothetical protein